MSRERYPSETAQRFQLRLGEGMRDALKKRAAANGRSMNSEIVTILRAALGMPEDEAAEPDPEDEADQLADLLICALDEWEIQNGRIIDDSDPHWSITARNLLIKLGRAL